MKPHIEQIVSPEQHSFLCRQFREPGFSHPFHYHPEIELTLITRSRGTRIVGDHVGSFEPGDLCLIGAKLPHIYRNLRPPVGGAASEVLHFRRELAGGLLDQAPELGAWSALLDAARQGLRFDARTGERAGGLLVALRQAEGPRRWRLFFELIECLLSAPPPTPLASVGFTGATGLASSQRLHEICQSLLEDFDREHSHAELARRLHTTPAYFSRLFKKTTRKTYTEFLTEVRLGHACRLLAETDLRIIDVAFQSGFRNLSHFNRCFKRRYQRTPRGYRQRLADAGEA